MSFDEWKEEVNVEVANLIGLSADDLPDFRYRDAYDAGETPEDVARQVVEAEITIFKELEGMF